MSFELAEIGRNDLQLVSAILVSVAHPIMPVEARSNAIEMDLLTAYSPSMITREQLTALLDYNAEDGNFRWRIRRNQHALAGSIAGTMHKRGYIYINAYNKVMLAHRLAWLYTYGSWPEDQIDHINGDRADNRIANLRLATRSENMKNIKMKSTNRSGFKGVTWFAKRKKWRAQITANGKHISLGLHSTPEQAAAAYAEGSKKYHGEFGRDS